ncbi:hypothetical protein [Phenylobacterium sp.]|uniref:hypothetical protein n=1 Tax=Phenylobacterium sp. TaxID=1871053 RepID=UPI0012209821|nr:hypothetical protein [Phenylobacterium sp.]THD70354.1 MAG: hypothetical protein E8A12_03205 [Phenylobacterium sp.]
MRTSWPLSAWLAAAVVAHLATDSADQLAPLPQTLQLYGPIVSYAVPAAVGLAASGRLTPWRAAAWAVLVAGAHSAAVFVTFKATPGFNEPLWMLGPAGGLGGLIGAAPALLGLIALGGAKLSRRTLLWAAGGSATLAVLGGVLCLALFMGGVDLLRAFALPVVLYLPWQIVFSLLVARISPARAGP